MTHEKCMVDITSSCISFSIYFEFGITLAIFRIVTLYIRFPNMALSLANGVHLTCIPKRLERKRVLAVTSEELDFWHYDPTKVLGEIHDMQASLGEPWFVQRPS